VPLEIIGRAVADYYAVNEAPYESAEGGYQGLTYDTDDVLDDIVGDISHRDDVLTAVRESFDHDIWVERNMFSLNGLRRYVVSWERFCDAVKHHTRYFFERGDADDFDKAIPVPRMLDALRELVEDSRLIRTLPADLLIHRVRSHKRPNNVRRARRWAHRPASKRPATA
jgi:hypothetical protein